MNEKLEEEIRNLSDEEKMIMIKHLYDQVEFWRDANEMKWELIQAMFQSKEANVTGLMQ